MTRLFVLGWSHVFEDWRRKWYDISKWVKRWKRMNFPSNDMATAYGFGLSFFCRFSLSGSWSFPLWTIIYTVWHDNDKLQICRCPFTSYQIPHWIRNNAQSTPNAHKNFPHFFVFLSVFSIVFFPQCTQFKFPMTIYNSFSSESSHFLRTMIRKLSPFLPLKALFQFISKTSIVPSEGWISWFLTNKFPEVWT